MRTLTVFLLSLMLWVPGRSFGQTDTMEVFDFDGNAANVPARYRLLYETGMSDEQRDAFRDSMAIQSITMSRSGCYGTCPIYTLSFHLDGRAEYEGKRFVEREGSYTGKIRLNDYGRLCYLIEQMDFKNLDSEYSTMVTDHASVTVIVEYKNGDRKEVLDYARQGPIELWALTQTLDAFKNEIRWEEREGKSDE